MCKHIFDNYITLYHLLFYNIIAIKKNSYTKITTILV